MYHLSDNTDPSQLSMSHQGVFWLRRLPARLDAQQTSRLLGFQPHDIPVLIRHHLLKPLGNPTPTATKWFATSEIIALGNDRQWLSKATHLIAKHWQTKNENKLRVIKPNHRMSS